LRALKAAQDWKSLWSQALPLVKHTVSKLIASGRLTSEQATDDLLQEGNLAAGRAVRTWDPDKGAFSTWIVRAAHGAILDHIQRTSSGMVGGRRSPGHTTQLFEESLEGSLREPEEEILRAQNAQMIRRAVETLKIPEDRELLKLVYGLEDDEPRTLVQIAKDWDMSERSIQRMYAAAMKKLAGCLNNWRYLPGDDK
jgi:RNA polymerase sigma factor (sigma-70 family)